MVVSFSLTRVLDLPSLHSLLPALLVADSVFFEDSPPRLVCSCEPQDVDRLEHELAARLAFLGEYLQAETSEVADRRTQALYREASAVLTIIVPRGNELPVELAAVLSECDVELRALRRLSAARASDPLALELYLERWEDCEGMRPQLQALAARWEIDLCLVPSDSKRPRRRLVAFDMDSTLIECEVIDELAARAGVGDEVAAITARAMRGELDFRSSFRERMSRLRGLPASEIDIVASQLPVMPGAASLLRVLRAQGHHTVILSGGFDFFARRLQQQLGFHEVHANRLEIADGQLTGCVRGEIIDGARKAQLLEETAVAQGFALEDTVAVGDGANDLPMLAMAALGVAFHAKPLVRERACCALNYGDLSALLFILGVPQPDEIR